MSDYIKRSDVPRTMAEKNDEIKRCPFCGGKAGIVIRSFDIFNHGAFVECKGCGARSKFVTEGVCYEARQMAIDLWNTRIK